ncbi:hypothetical protein [Bacillus sp. FSL K6-2860]|uniref:hypothetical protein n=1 Tax=Bacillus sp. FSL K6-2860 TaxID=2921483 RepID=UPI0030F95675
MKNDVIEHVKFSDLNVNDPFFLSLIEDYEGFKHWFIKKSNQGEKVYILKEQKLMGFLYLKEENEESIDINPKFPKKRRLKIGTFKIDAHGTVLGQRFIGLILKQMIEQKHNECYVTIFNKQQPLIKLFEKFGFKLWGSKENGELIYVKTLEYHNNLYKDFPRIQSQNSSKYILSIYPEYHTKLFPYSRLQTENDHKVEDLSFTNTLEKVYLAKMYGMDKLKSGDLIIIYRTAENNKSAEYSSVITSVCSVVDTRNINEFHTKEEFIKYCGKGTIFNTGELNYFWSTKRYPYIVKMLYNISLPKRIIRRELIENQVINRSDYAGFLPLTNSQFEKIIELGEVNESFIIN